MNDEQIKEVMRRADDYAFIASCETERSADSDPGCDEEREETCSSRAALKAYLRTIGEPAQSVNAELLDAAKSVLANVERFHSASAEEDGFRGWQTGRGVGIGDALQDSIDALKLVVSESAIETPAKVSPCAGHAAQQGADERPRDVILKVAGKSFYCSCGCNVFQKLDPDNENEYTCNACHATYEAGGA